MSAESNNVIEKLAAERRNNVIDSRDWGLSDWDLLRVGEDVVEVTWIDAALFDMMAPEDLEESFEALATKSYGLVYRVTEDYIILLSNAVLRTDFSINSTAENGNTAFAVPIGTVKQLRVLKPAERPERAASQNGVFCDKSEGGTP